MERITQWVDKGQVRVSVDKEFQFTEQDVKAMYAYNMAGRTRGKTALIIVPAA